jgi:DHA1 family solute carrier family 18 vesicular amine transporter 1/2
VLRLALALALAQVGFHAFIASLPLALVTAGRPDPEIGVLMGSAAVVPMAAALAAGGLIDRYGGRQVFLVGTGAFLAAAMLFVSGLVSPESAFVLLLVPRVLQGIGLAFVLPAALSLVPALVGDAGLGTALGLVGMGANVSLAVSPPISLALLDEFSLRAVAAAAIVAVVAGAVLLWPLNVAGVRGNPAGSGDPPGRRLSAFRPAWSDAWRGPLLLSLLFVAHWGVVTGYLPQRAEANGADVGLFFTADALAIMALRVPGGYLAGRLGPRPVILAGILVTLASLVILLPSPTTLLLVLSGLGTGAGGALILPPVTLELSNRSTDADRGSAFALFQVAFSAGIALGSIGLAPIVGAVGFEVALAVGIAGCAAAGAVAIVDRPSSAAAARVGVEPT